MTRHRVEPGLHREADNAYGYETAAPQAAPTAQYDWQSAPAAEAGAFAAHAAPAYGENPAPQGQAAWLQNQPRVDYVPQSDPQDAAGYHAAAAAAGGYAAAPQNTYAPQPATAAPAAGGYYADAAPQYQQAAAAPASAMPKLGPAQWIGAGLSFALVLGLGVWGVQLMMRDVRGVPVIRALEGEARLVPADPGGQLAMHQGLAVNSVTAGGSAAAPADQLTLAPRPTSLTSEDQPMGAQAATLTAYVPQTDAYDIQTEEADAALAATAQSLTDLQKVEVVTDPLELETIETVAADEPRGVPIPVDPNIYASPRPKLRPSRLAAVSTAVASPTATPDLNDVANQLMAAVGTSGEIQTGDVPVGARLVQFSAFHSAEIARKEWDRLAGKFGELLDGKKRVIEMADSGGKTFYRLRAYGFADAQDANRFCAAVTAMNEQCVPTVKR